MAIDDAVVDTIKARLLMMNKTLEKWPPKFILYIFSGFFLSLGLKFRS